MRISDWSSDVCSSDLTAAPMFFNQIPAWFGDELATIALENGGDIIFGVPEQIPGEASGTLQFNSAVSIGNVPPQDRKSVGSGKSVSVRVDLGGSRIIKKKNKYQ